MTKTSISSLEWKQGMKISVIDLGFNSLKMVNYHAGRKNSIRVCSEFGVKARLGDGLIRRRTLAPEAVRRTIDGLEICRDIIRVESIKHIIPVGTSPLREAADRNKFLRRVLRETGFRIRVLSSREEALYSFLGAVTSTGRKNSLFFDLGGGSLEIVYMKKSRIWRVISLPLGSLRLTQLYADENGNFSSRNYSRMKKHIMKLLPGRSEIGMTENSALVGVGGTVRALARYEQENMEYPFDKIHNFTVRFASLERMARKFSEMPVEKLQSIQSFGNGRAATVTAGSAVVSLLMKKLRLKELVVSTHGLRDGIVISFVNSSLSFRRNSDFAAAVEKSLHSAGTISAPRKATQIIRALKDGAMLDSSESLILTRLMHGVPDEMSASSPEALFYTLMCEDSALSHRQQMVLALSAAGSRNQRISNRLLLRYRDIVKPEDRRSMEKITACLKLLELLEKGASAVRIRARGSALNIDILPGARFPDKLLKRTIRNINNNFGFPIIFTVNDSKFDSTGPGITEVRKVNR